jgi:hypothetical protein
LYSYITQGVDLPGPSGALIGTGQVYNQPSQITFSSQQITDLFNEMYYDELNHLIDLRALIESYTPGVPVGNTAVVGRQTMNLLGTSAPNATFAAPSGTTVLSQAQAIGLARLLEDLSVQAFIGASSYLTGTNLQYAAQVLAADGFHAGAIRLLSIQTGAPYQGVQQATSFQVGTVAGNNVLTAISTIPTALVVGQPLSGTGIPAGAVVTAFTSNAAKTPTGVITKGSMTIAGVSSTSGIAVGQPITGTDIPALTYVSAVGTGTITISQNVTATPAAEAPTGIVTAGSATITSVSALTGLTVGQPITGTGIAANATLVSFTGTTIVMSAPATATSTLTVTGVTQSGSVAITGVSNITGIVTGTLGLITGPGIPAGTSVTATAPGSITLSAKATASSLTNTGTVTAGSTTISVSSTTGLTVGMGVIGTGVPSGATITAIGVGNITISTVATASGANETLTYGAVLTAITTQTVTSPANETITIGQSTITISMPATVTGSTTALAVIADANGFDVAPVDPGSASAAAAGPVANSTATPTVYQGFFDTAGAASSSAATPPGFAFARTFSQVLAVLYASNTLNTFEGGFYPVGVSGNINVV